MRDGVRPMRLVRGLVCGIAVALLVGAGAPAIGRADDTGAPAPGDVEPVTSLLQQVRTEFPGRVLTVELEQETLSGDRRMVYEVKVLTARGDVLKVYYDAHTLAVQRIVGRTSSDRTQAGNVPERTEAETESRDDSQSDRDAGDSGGDSGGDGGDSGGDD